METQTWVIGNDDPCRLAIWNNCVGQSGGYIGMAEAINLDRDAHRRVGFCLSSGGDIPIETAPSDPARATCPLGLCNVCAAYP